MHSCLQPKLGELPGIVVQSSGASTWLVEKSQGKQGLSRTPEVTEKAPLLPRYMKERWKFVQL